MANDTIEIKDIDYLQTETNDVPNGSILCCDKKGHPYWLCPDGEILLFDLVGLVMHRGKI